MEIAEKKETIVRSSFGTVTTNKIWKFEIYNAEELQKAHPEFFIPDDKKIREYILSRREEFQENGLRAYQDTVISSRL